LQKNVFELSLSYLLLILCTRTTGYSSHRFVVSGPRCWDGLPSAMKSPSVSILLFYG